MKKLLIVIGTILLAFAVYYFMTPNQTRLSDEDAANLNDTEVDQDELVTERYENGETHDEGIAVYYFAGDDSQCQGDVQPVYFTDVDSRYEFQEINALVTLLTHRVPEGYRSAIISGTQLNQLQISKGVATADLGGFINLSPDESCGFAARREQIEATLQQFESIDSVDILANGESIE